MKTPIQSLLTAETKEEIFNAWNRGIRRSPMRQLLDFITTNHTLLEEYLQKEVPEKEDQRELIEAQIAFNCMSVLYQLRIGDQNQSTKIAMQMKINDL